ncbi:MAG: hypothetical protein J0M26_09835 [Planctomycetes bacterium]|nr:hypothetical protein [Planctomycetota bacterium]
MQLNVTQLLHRPWSFFAQRCISWAITLLAVAITLCCVWGLTVRFGRSDLFTGYSLLGVCLLLAFLSIRKRMLALPIGPVKVWLQIHLYAGVLSLVLFVLHVGWFNGGWLELMLGSLFLWIAGTGLYLWYLSRRIPKRLLAVGRDVVLEEIPRLQQQHAEQAYELALKSTQLGEGVTLADYYQQKLVPYFHAPRSLFFGIVPSIRTRRRLLRELDTLDRYLGTEGRALRNQICDLVRKKDELDVHWAMQNQLRFCLTMHIVGLWALALLITVHVTTVLAFVQRG